MLRRPWGPEGEDQEDPRVPEIRIQAFFHFVLFYFVSVFLLLVTAEPEQPSQRS